MAASVCAKVDHDTASLQAYGTSWGIDPRNTRFQPRSDLTAANAGRLELAWTYRLGSLTPRAYPLVTASTIFVGSDGEGIIALDRETGCERWRYPHDGNVGSAILPAEIQGRAALVFNDRQRGTFAIDANDGQLLWHTQIDEEPVPWYSGSPLIAGDQVILPISSLEVGLAVNPLYGCCTTSGGIAALDLNTGALNWYTPTIEEEARPQGSHYLFVTRYGPSGAAVWGAPSYDRDRGVVFFGTGQNYSHPTTDTSDALFAVDARTGAVIWRRQFTQNDAYNASCNVISLDHPNCPKPLGPDVDFGAATLIARDRSGRSLLIGGQKSADVYAVDPLTGDVRWQTNLGRGGIIGGVHWGMAVSEADNLLFVPNSDKGIDSFPSPGEPRPGLYALDLTDGAIRWRFVRNARCEEPACEFGMSAAIIAANDVVVAGSIDGHLEVIETRSGTSVWTFDAWRQFEAVNGGKAVGGGFDAHGPLLADDLMIVTAGYSYVGDQRGGNALLVFKIGTP